ncbi:MAG: amino acid ABC transporter ATP-binding protein [Acidaminococcaceae bacterium]|jgi:polar amino acid transport system ATP-binding protein|nr:amino acid ABC transporter ATP-binding protein [Acidaminococcaceae bacterium]
MTQSLLKVENLRKDFGAQTILQDVSLDVHQGEVVVIVGPSGCGKSTFLRCLNGLEPVTGGRVLLDGKCISDGSVPRSEICQHIGMVFQSYDLFNHLTVLDNIALAPVEVQHRDPEEVRCRSRELLARIGLAGKENAYPRELSGGQKQRIAMVRALILNPEIMLFDEVTASLDPEMVREVLDMMMELARGGMTMLIVTHEMSFARAVADKVYFFDQGGIVESGAPADFFEHPVTARGQKFLDSFIFNERRTKERIS